MDIQRILLPHVKRRLQTIPAVGLVGSRQVGKTTLAKQVLRSMEKAAIYIDLESPEDLNKLRMPERYLNERADRLLIIDEVQRMPELFPMLRSVIDKKRRNGRFLLLGSASPELLAGSSESLAGRISFFEVNPFGYLEVSSNYTMEQLWLRGGYPEMLLAADDTVSYRNRLDLITTYVERELPFLGLSVSAVLLRKLLSMVAHLHGNLLNYADLSRSLGLTLNTVKRYLDYFEHAYIIRRVQPWYANVSKRQVKSPKVYLRDSGLLHAVNGLVTMEDLEGFPMKGNSWEGFVIQQIIAALVPDCSSWFYRTQDGAEIDLVLTRGNKPVVGIEVKYSNAPRPSRGSTIAARDLGDISLLLVTPSVSEDYQLDESKTVTSFERVFFHLDRLGLLMADNTRAV
jgi:uncharacterized protein